MLDNVAWLCTLLGSLVLLIGWALLQPEEDDRRLGAKLGQGRDRLLEADDAAVVVRGRVAVEEDARLLVAPFTQREVVWMRVDVDEAQRSERGAWEVRVHVHDETRFVPFYLDDGAGGRVLVSLENADVVLPRELVMNQTVVQLAPPEALAYLAANDIPSLSRGTYDKKMWFYERTIRVGDELHVVGRGTKERASIEDYRNADTRLHLGAGLGPENRLVVTKSPTARLLATLRPSRSLGWSMTVVGALSLLFGVLAFLREYGR